MLVLENTDLHKFVPNPSFGQPCVLRVGPTEGTRAPKSARSAPSAAAETWYSSLISTTETRLSGSSEEMAKSGDTGGSKEEDSSTDHLGGWRVLWGWMVTMDYAFNWFWALEKIGWDLDHLKSQW